MKTKNIFQCLLVVAALFTYSCSSDSDGDSGDGGSGGTSGLTSITITASQLSFEIGDSVTFTVTGNDGSNVTTEATVLVNNSSIQGNEYTPTATGGYQIKATYDGLTSATINLEVTPPVILALRVESSADNIKVGDTADFTVFGTNALNDEYDVTNSAIVSVDGTAIDGNRFMATSMGTLSATASIGEIVSDAVSVTVGEETAPGTFQKTVNIIDATGTWCQFCPRVSYGIELVEDATDKAFIIAAHSGGGDVMENPASIALVNQVNPAGTFPTAVLNGTIDWAFPEPDNVAQVTNLATGTTSRGLSVNSLVVGDNLQVYVSAAFAQAMPNAKLAVYVLESGIDAPQINGTSYYGGVNPLTEADGFTHNHTLRSSLTAVLGDAIPAGNTGAGQKYTQVFNVPIPASILDRNEISVVAMIIGDNFEIVASNGGHTGVDKDFN
ncbi:outer membrane protein Omp28 [Kordia sp. SMS9]|uniref:Omp28-related outer membrane protein n=1 Tax=Kordia sp. SMS9 TaxID=2282170 RepID=UPI000E0DBAB3|nr:Omp28-related outer membrane protein [Kordia sp. SMS9]AXG69916.1 outer membrane protein Omp28 [Kordia sp. SMS9]